MIGEEQGQRVVWEQAGISSLNRYGVFEESYRRFSTYIDLFPTIFSYKRMANMLERHLTQVKDAATPDDIAIRNAAMGFVHEIFSIWSRYASREPEMFQLQARLANYELHITEDVGQRQILFGLARDAWVQAANALPFSPLHIDMCGKGILALALEVPAQQKELWEQGNLFFQRSVELNPYDPYNWSCWRHYVFGCEEQGLDGTTYIRSFMDSCLETAGQESCPPENAYALVQIVAEQIVRDMVLEKSSKETQLAWFQEYCGKAASILEQVQARLPSDAVLRLQRGLMLLALSAVSEPGDKVARLAEADAIILDLPFEHNGQLTMLQACVNAQLSFTAPDAGHRLTLYESAIGKYTSGNILSQKNDSRGFLWPSSGLDKTWAYTRLLMICDREQQPQWRKELFASLFQDSFNLYNCSDVLFPGAGVLNPDIFNLAISLPLEEGRNLLKDLVGPYHFSLGDAFYEENYSDPGFYTSGLTLKKTLLFQKQLYLASDYPEDAMDDTLRETLRNQAKCSTGTEEDRIGYSFLIVSEASYREVPSDMRERLEEAVRLLENDQSPFAIYFKAAAFALLGDARQCKTTLERLLTTSSPDQPTIISAFYTPAFAVVRDEEWFWGLLVASLPGQEPAQRCLDTLLQPFTNLSREYLQFFDNTEF